MRGADLLVGIRTEEARALRWDHVVTWVDDPAGWQPVASAGFDPSRAGEGRFAIYVWRSEREGGDPTPGIPRARWPCSGGAVNGIVLGRPGQTSNLST